MIKKLIIPAIGLAIAMPNIATAASRQLVVDAQKAYLMFENKQSDTGTGEIYCYSDGDIGDFVVASCQTDTGNAPSLPTCPNYIDTGNEYECFIGSYKGYNFYCYSGGENGCAFCGNDTKTGTVLFYSLWQNTGNNRVTRKKYFKDLDYGGYNTDYYDCAITMNNSTEYGCAAGYYQSGGTGATMTCAQCPASGGTRGTNAIGTTAITTCCIPAGTTFSDTYGSGKYTEPCCYKE